MDKQSRSTKGVRCLRHLAPVMITLAVLCHTQALAQIALEPGRFYWKGLAGANAVPVIGMSVSSNSNPFNPAHTLLPAASVEANMAVGGYAKILPLFDRSAMVAILLPMGELSGQATIGGRVFSQSSSGFGDPMLQLGINVLGPKVQRTIPDVLRYEPGLSVDLIGNLAFPVGENDSDQALNLGQNRWYGRLGAPVVWQLGPWVPGRRTTLELLPAVWLFGPNNDFVGGTLKTDPLFQVDVHLTRDFTEHFWGAVDSTYFEGGRSSIGGVETPKLSVISLGFTLGYEINDNLQLTTAYNSTVNDDNPGDLRLSVFRVSLVFGWHSVIEGMKRLKGEE